MKLLKKSLALLLVMVLMMGAFSSLKAEAKEITLKTPKIKSVKLSKDGTSISITINKTNKDVEGYEVYISGEGVYDNSLYQSKEEVFSTAMDYSFDNELFARTEQPGTKKQTVKINVEDLVKIYGGLEYKTFPPIKYTVKVRGYKREEFETVWSEYSKEKSLNVSITETIGEGYKTEYDFSKVSKGDIITFGAYEQDANIKNGQEPIEWVVLSKTKSKLFVVSKYALDCLPYNLECEDVTWETCTLRKWLNEKFYSAAFNKTEQDMIKTAALKNTDNPYSKMPGGNDTKDKVFLLSLSDMMKSDYGFSDDYDTEDQNRTCAPTEYALARGILSNSHYANTKEDEVACVWWLRSPGKYEDWKEFVDDDGTVRDGRSDVYWAWFGVRPALVINLNP